MATRQAGQANRVDVTVDIGGQPRTLKFRPMSELPIGLVRRIRSNAEEKLWAPIEWGIDPADIDVLDEAPMSLLETLIDAWSKASDTSLGESNAS